MGRFLAGVASALLLVAAGLIWWSGRAETEAVIPPAPAAPAAISADAPAEPPQATEKTREERRFNRYDKDRNGAIAREEYLVSRRKAYVRLDANGDGRLSFEEWAIRTTTKFATADDDRSGTLDAAEFLTTRVIRKPRASAANCPPPGRKEEDEG